MSDYELRYDLAIRLYRELMQASDQIAEIALLRLVEARARRLALAYSAYRRDWSIDIRSREIECELASEEVLDALKILDDWRRDDRRRKEA